MKTKKSSFIMAHPTHGRTSLPPRSIDSSITSAMPRPTWGDRRSRSGSASSSLNATSRSSTAMPDPGAVLNLRSEVLEELTGRILPFWMNHTVDERDGGFYGRITHDGKVVEDALKGAILNARILWTFSAAGRLLGNSAYRPFAD